MKTKIVTPRGRVHNARCWQCSTLYSYANALAKVAASLWVSSTVYKSFGFRLQRVRVNSQSRSAGLYGFLFFPPVLSKVSTRQMNRHTSYVLSHAIAYIIHACILFYKLK